MRLQYQYAGLPQEGTTEQFIGGVFCDGKVTDISRHDTALDDDVYSYDNQRFPAFCRQWTRNLLVGYLLRVIYRKAATARKCVIWWCLS